MSNTSLDQKTEHRKSLAFGFASPIVGLTLALIIGMAVSDLLKNTDNAEAILVWVGVIIIAIIGASLVFGAHFAALAVNDADSSKGPAKAASVLNLVVVSIWSYVTLGISLSGGVGAIMMLQDWGAAGNTPNLRAMNADDFWNHLLPASVMMILLLTVVYVFVVLRSKGRKS